jgi:hypothetical protein
MLRHLKENGHEGVFNPQEARMMAAAFEEAWKAVQDSKAQFASNSQAEAMRETLARRIFVMARIGERNRHRLRDDALRYLARMKRTTIGNPG